MIEFEIDGQRIQAESGMNIIEAADEAGITIPRFCYHPDLSVVANCRMCLVDVENARNPLPACATPVTSGMRVSTRSEKAVQAQRAVMEYLLVNHPLDCPICDQGGECELQDTSMGYGSGFSHYRDVKRSVLKKDIGPLIDTEMTRCIHCTRCVRFGEEIAGLRELGVTARGEHEEIGTYVQHFLHSEVSANVIDLCPVGALTSKPFRYQCRSWELNEYPGIAAHDAWGSPVYWHVRRSDLPEKCQVMRVVPRVDDKINQWMSDRDRFSYEGFYHKQRLKAPSVKAAGQWRQSTWQKAMPDMLDKLQRIIDQYGHDEVAVLVSPNMTTESGFMIQHVMRALGVPHIDHRIMVQDTQDQDTQPIFMGSTVLLSELQDADAFYCLGADLNREHPLVGLRVRQAVLDGASVFMLHAKAPQHHFTVTTEWLDAPQSWVDHLLALIHEAQAQGLSLPAGVELPDVVPAPTAEQQACVRALQSAASPIIWLGLQAYQHPQASSLRYYSRVLAQMVGGEFIAATAGANSAGLSLAGVLPHRGVAADALKQNGDVASAMWEKPRRAYVLFDVEPHVDCAQSGAAKAALQSAELVVAFNSFSSDDLHEVAHYLFPTTVVAEQSGSFVNLCGQWQDFSAVVPEYNQARPVWKIMRLIAQLLNLPDCDVGNVDAISAHVKSLLPEPSAALKWRGWQRCQLDHSNDTPLMRLGYWPLYRVDSVVRRAPSLQATHQRLNPHAAYAQCHSATAKQYGLSDEKSVVLEQDHVSRTFTVLVNDSVAVGCVYLASGEDVTTGWGEACAPIHIIQEGGADVV